MKTKDLEDKTKLILLVIILVAVGGSYLGLSTDTINWINELLISMLIGLFLSAVVGSIIEAFTRDFLKTIFLNIPIFGDFSISISAFAIATFIVKVWLFGL